ncbi:MAG: hypothetical protein FE78DRAFT_155304 [Acidomyces sp. 'richmondensis']|nr:MAG: hypothetical protein FE78DRAFT_155304 [Acidomyces sp. 'richmondensis']
MDPRRAAIQQYWHEQGFTGIFARAAFRICQFTTAMVAASIYGACLAHKDIHMPSTNWIYAEVVSTLSILTCAFHCFLTVKSVAWVLWDLVLSILWAACAGVFGTTYLTIPAETSKGYSDVGLVPSMKAAFVFDLISMSLWLMTFVQGITWCCHTHRLIRRVDKSQAESDPVALLEQATAKQRRPPM